MTQQVKRRLFFGLEVPDAVKARLLSIQCPLQGARWHQPEQLHLTLVFLGGVDEDQLEAVRSAAQNLPVKPFSVKLSGIGCFGQPDRPRYLWAGVEPSEALVALQEALSQRLAVLGFKKEERLFIPHVTLARFNQRAGTIQSLLAANGDVSAGALPVTFISLFQSSQGPSGSVYTVLNRFSLKGD